MAHTLSHTRPLRLPSLTLWLCALLAAVPLLAAAAALFAPGSDGWRHLVSTQLGTYVTNSLLLMGGVAVLSGLIGISTAWLVTATQFPGRRWLSAALILPIAAPAYILAYAYTDLLSVSGPVQSSMRAVLGTVGSQAVLPPIRTLPGATLMLALTLYPYVYLLARAAFLRQAQSQFHAARSLGAGPWRAFFTIALPGARPAIAGGLALVMMETLADFAVADYFAIPTFSTGIYRSWLATGDMQLALKLAGVMLLLVAFVVVLEQISRKGRTDDAGRSAARISPAPLRRGPALLAMLVCGAPVVLGFVLPTALLLGLAITQGDPLGLPAIAALTGRTLALASVTCLLATGLALFLAYHARQSEQPGQRAALRLATLGYALPGTLLAVGLLGPVGGLDRWLTGTLRDAGLWNGGLIVSGTAGLLIYAYVIRFLTVSYNAVGGALSKVSPTMDAAARSLGAGPWQVAWRIQMPLIRPGIAASLLLVSVDVVRELPATLILRPFNFETLATRVYWLASDERLSQASTAALIIIAAGLIPAALLIRLDRGR